MNASLLAFVRLRPYDGEHCFLWEIGFTCAALFPFKSLSATHFLGELWKVVCFHLSGLCRDSRSRMLEVVTARCDGTHYEILDYRCINGLFFATGSYVIDSSW